MANCGGRIWTRPADAGLWSLLSRDSAYRLRQYVTVAPVTTRVRHLPGEVILGPEDGLTRDSVVNLDVINAVPTNRLQRRIARLAPEKIAAVDAAIHFALGMEA